MGKTHKDHYLGAPGSLEPGVSATPRNIWALAMSHNFIWLVPCSGHLLICHKLPLLGVTKQKPYHYAHGARRAQRAGFSLAPHVGGLSQGDANGRGPLQTPPPTWLCRGCHTGVRRFPKGPGTVFEAACVLLKISSQKHMASLPSHSLGGRRRKPTRVRGGRQRPHPAVEEWSEGGGHCRELFRCHFSGLPACLSPRTVPSGQPGAPRL